MASIDNLFHVIHVVDDVEGVDEWYENIFGGRRIFWRQFSKHELRDASMMVFSDCVIEVMSPSNVEGAQDKPVGRFHGRFGQRLHSIAFFVTGLPELFERLRARDIPLYGDGGGRIERPPERGAIYTHPRQTYGQLEFMERIGDARDPRFQPGWAPGYWRDEHPLGLERMSHLTVVVRDLDQAKEFYGGLLEGKLLHEGSSRLAANSAFFQVSPDTIVELARPSNGDSLAAQDLEANGQMLHAVTFKVKDLDQAGRHLEGLGVKANPLGSEALEVGPDQAFGARLIFCRDTIPNDPRA